MFNVGNLVANTAKSNGPGTSRGAEAANPLGFLRGKSCGACPEARSRRTKASLVPAFPVRYAQTPGPPRQPAPWSWCQAAAADYADRRSRGTSRGGRHRTKLHNCRSLERVRAFWGVLGPCADDAVGRRREKACRSSRSLTGAGVSGAILVNAPTLVLWDLLQRYAVAISRATGINAFRFSCLSRRQSERCEVARVQGSRADCQKQREDRADAGKVTPTAFHGLSPQVEKRGELLRVVVACSRRRQWCSGNSR